MKNLPFRSHKIMILNSVGQVVHQTNLYSGEESIFVVALEEGVYTLYIEGVGRALFMKAH